jgi:hypothetical protein
MNKSFNKVARVILFWSPFALGAVEFIIRELTGHQQEVSFYALGLLVAGLGLMFGLAVPPPPLGDPCQYQSERDREEYHRRSLRHSVEESQAAYSIGIAFAGVLLWFLLLVAELYAPWKL